MINLTDKYKTRCGYPVEVLCVDLTGNSPVLYTYIDDSNLKFYATADMYGRYYRKTDSRIDLIKVTPYDHIKKGDVVWVWDDDETDKKLRLFVSVENDIYSVKTAIDKELTESGHFKHCELYQAKDEK